MLGITVLLSQIACTGFIERQAAESTYALMQKSRQAVQQGGDVEVARLAAPGGLIQLEAFRLSYPWHKGFAALLAEASCQYALGFVQWEWEQAAVRGDDDLEDTKRRAMASLRKCQRHALDHAGLKKRVAANPGAEIDEALRASKEKMRPNRRRALIWYAAAGLGRVAISPLRPEALEKLPKLEKLMASLSKGPVDADTAQLYMVMGAYACSKPRFLGGDVDEGLAWLDKAARASKGPGLMSKVVSARACSVARSDEEGFVALLEEATTADLSQWPDSRLENELAASKARFYLRHRDQWFENEKELAHGN